MVTLRLHGSKPHIYNKFPLEQKIPRPLAAGIFYFDEPKETYVGEVKSRPATIPVSIDRYGCLTAIAE
jgi:hypothetical protein